MNSLHILNKRNIDFRYSAFIGLIIIISYIAVLTFLKDNSYLNIALSDIMAIIISSMAALCLFYAAFKSKIYGKQIYIAWLLLGIAQLLYALGDVVWTFIELYLNNVPFPSTADNLYLLYYVLFAIGLLLLTRPVITRAKMYRTILDMGIVIISALIILWTTIASSLGTVNNFLPLSLTLYYIIRDFVLFFLLINLIFIYSTIRVRNPFILLLGGISAYIITDAAFSYLFLNGMYISGSLVDAGWVVAFVLIGLAGILQGNNAGMETPETVKQIERSSKPFLSSFIPLIWIGLAIFMLIWGYYNLPPSNFVIIQLKFVLFIILIIIRYMLYYLEKKGLINSLINIKKLG